MLPTIGLNVNEFRPDIPEESVKVFGVSNDNNSNNNNNNNNTQRISSRDMIEREMQEKEDYRKRRLKDEKEFEEYRQNARFAQTDYSSFDSEIVDRPVEMYYCSHCGHYCMVTETSLNDCLIRNIDTSFVLDIKNQIFRMPGLYDGSKIILKRLNVVTQSNNDNDIDINTNTNTNNNNNNNNNDNKTKYKLEIQYRMHCSSCCLPIGYRHDSDINHCNRIFILNDSLSNDPLTFQKKISELKTTFSIASKGSSFDLASTLDDFYQ